LRNEQIRGRIGQPSTPMRLNPDAHHYVAYNIGRRSLELAVVNFIGETKSFKRIQQSYPTPRSALEFLQSNLTPLLRAAKRNKKSISGMAVAMPFELWNWTEEFEAPQEEMEAWRDLDAARKFEEIVPWTVAVENDATAACRAEQVFGAHANLQDWIYFFVGTFIGGGIVLNGSVFPGRRGNAGGFGPMRVPEKEGGDRLVDHASLVVLEREIAAAGGQPLEIYDEDADWSKFEPMVSEWISRAARNLVHAIVSSLSVLDFEAVVIDGAMPDTVKARLVGEVRRQMERADLQGVFVPKIESGQIGRRACAVGGAATLISKNYLVDQNTLMRD